MCYLYFWSQNIGGSHPLQFFFLWVEGHPAPFSLPFCYLSNTGIKNFSFLCWMLCIVGQKVSTKFLMVALSDCFPSSSCILLCKFWNLLPNNDSIHVEETKIWLLFKTWCSLSVPRCAVYLKGNWNSWCLYRYANSYEWTLLFRTLLWPQIKRMHYLNPFSQLIIIITNEIWEFETKE